MKTPEFDITPERLASTSYYYYKYFFVTPRPLTKGEVDLRGKTAIVTGSNVGIGLEASHQLLDLGLSRLILAVRSKAKGDTARDNLLSGRDPKSCVIEVWELDLESYESITKFADKAKGLDRLDIAILNAGIFKATEQFNPSTGFEMDVQINFLSTALLALLLLPTLKKNPATYPSRLVFVSSDTVLSARVRQSSSPQILESFKQKSRKWDFGEQYGTSKLLGLLFMIELAKHVPSSVITITAGNPGFCYGSDFQREGEGTVLGFLFRYYTRLVGRPSSVGARSVVHAAANWGEEAHSQYIEDSKLRPQPLMCYTPEGERVGKQVWEETLNELSFAGVQDILATFKN